MMNKSLDEWELRVFDKSNECVIWEKKLDKDLLAWFIRQSVEGISQYKASYYEIFYNNRYVRKVTI